MRISIIKNIPALLTHFENISNQEHPLALLFLLSQRPQRNQASLSLVNIESNFLLSPQP